MEAKRISPSARIKGMVRNCLILTFLLGITWILGFIQKWIDSSSGNKATARTFSFIFILLNCSTGIFIFVYTVILDAKMMEASKRTIQRTSRRFSRYSKDITSSTRLSVSRRLSKMSGSLKHSSTSVIKSSNNSVKKDRKISTEQAGIKVEKLSIQSVNSNASDNVPILNRLNSNKSLR